MVLRKVLLQHGPQTLRAVVATIGATPSRAKFAGASAKGLRLHRSAVPAHFAVWRKISGSAFWDYCKHYRPIPEIGVRQCRNSEALDGFKIPDATVVRVVGALLFFAGLIGLVLFENFVDHATDADRNTSRSAFRESQNF
jgi:hypothetical protein